MVTPLVMLSILPASPLPFFSQLEFLGRALEGAGTAPSESCRYLGGVGVT